MAHSCIRETVRQLSCVACSKSERHWRFDSSTPHHFGMMTMPFARSVTFERITLGSLKKRSGLPFRDGSRVQYVSYLIGGSIQAAGTRSAGVFHNVQERYGIEHFASCGYRIFPRHVGIDGVKGWADFAAARYRRVILIEYMTDWWVDSTASRRCERFERFLRERTR